MPDPVVVEDQSITTAGKQKLVIDRKELEKMNGKRVLVVDDVISTGGSLKALDALAEKTQCTIVGQAAVLAARISSSLSRCPCSSTKPGCAARSARSAPE